MRKEGNLPQSANHEDREEKKEESKGGENNWRDSETKGEEKWRKGKDTPHKARGELIQPTCSP